jgi:hypothetical protein
VRGLRLAELEPRGDRSLWEAATAVLDPELADRPLAPDVEAARTLIEAWVGELP